MSRLAGPSLLTAALALAPAGAGASGSSADTQDAAVGPAEDGDGADTGAGASVSTEGASAGGSSRRVRRKEEDARRIAAERQKPWIRRWEPTRHMVEIGGYGGIFMPSTEHDLYEARTAPPDPFWQVGGELGARAAYFPLRPLGVEAEFGANLLRMRNLTNDPVFVFGFRGHVIVQMPVYRIVPFLLGGYGLLGVRSNVIIQGDDTDPAFHYGGGIKINILRRLSGRVEARQIVSATEAKQDSGTFHFQALAGLSLVLNRKLPEPAPIPPPPDDPDRDSDGFLNEVDECPDDAGVAPSGCPDSDGDSFVDNVDACPEVPGVDPDGCPMKDTDRDKIADLNDECVFQPETYNNRDDADGCPDDLPPVLVSLKEELRGIQFEFGKDTIRAESTPVLDKVVDAMNEFPLVEVRIVGHTDNVGKPETNLDLSKRRAASVKKYLVSHGLDAGRIETDGKGDTAPVATNETEAGRAKNRRIEFIITKNPVMEVPAGEG